MNEEFEMLDIRTCGVLYALWTISIRSTLGVFPAGSLNLSLKISQDFGNFRILEN